MNLGMSMSRPVRCAGSTQTETLLGAHAFMIFSRSSVVWMLLLTCGCRATSTPAFVEAEASFFVFSIAESMSLSKRQSHPTDEPNPLTILGMLGDASIATADTVRPAL